MSSTSSFLALPQELRDQVYEEAFPKEITITYKWIVAKGIRQLQIFVRNPQAFQSINGFLSASREIRSDAKRAIARELQQKATLVIDCRDQEQLSKQTANNYSPCLPPSFYENCPRLKLLLPVSICPRNLFAAHTVSASPHLVGYLEATFAHTKGSGHSWETESVVWHTISSNSANERETSQFMITVESLKQVVTQRGMHVLPRGGIRPANLQNLRDHFIGSQGNLNLLGIHEQWRAGSWAWVKKSDDALADYHAFKG